MHPEYLKPLRQEIEGPAYQIWETTGNGLPLLDSFLKESARMNPLDNCMYHSLPPQYLILRSFWLTMNTIVSTRRRVLKPFRMSNGVYLERGDWLATPLTPMLRDPKNWTNPLDFHGFRHVNAEILASLEEPIIFMSPEPEKAAPLTDTRGWQTWGTGRMAW